MFELSSGSRVVVTDIFTEVVCDVWNHIIGRVTTTCMCCRHHEKLDKKLSLFRDQLNSARDVCT